MKILITGGCGFVGANAALYFLKKGHNVIVTDNLSRKGSEINSKMLANAGGQVERIIGPDIVQDSDFFRFLIDDRDVGVIIHTAAQVAVTTSVGNPIRDFEVNALGTLRLLEAARGSDKKPIVIFTSTNKVYGEMKDIGVAEKETRYEYRDYPFGISEEQKIDFHSPYGCSKGCADQYVRDYYRIYGLPTIVFRQSCIYGVHQFGIVDQGWVSFLSIAALLENPVTIYGNGKQVRDVLFAKDLNRAFDLAIKKINKTKGQIYNIGGGPNNTTSVLELISMLEKIAGRKIDPGFSNWRPGDQRVYISDIRKAKKDFGWEPKVSFKDGLCRTVDWLRKNKNLFI